MTDTAPQSEHTEQALIAGKSLSYYWQAVRWFVAGLVALEILNVWLSVIPYGRWVLSGLMAIGLTWWMAKRGRGSMMVAIVSSAIMGVVAGLALAIFDIIWYHQWWYVLNIIRMPFLLGMIGIATGFTFYVLFRSMITKRERSDSKGGGIYGRTKTN